MIIFHESELICIILLPTEKILTFHEFIILNKSVVNNKNDYYCNIFLQKHLYKDEFTTQYF